VVAFLSVLVLGSSGILAGVLAAVALGIVPAFMGLTPQQYIPVHKLVGQYFDRVMPPLVISSTIVDAILAGVVSSTLRAAFFAVAAFALVGVSLISQLGNVPINKVVKQTDPLLIDQHWADPRPRWARWHLARTLLSLSALAANIVAALVR